MMQLGRRSLHFRRRASAFVSIATGRSEKSGAGGLVHLGGQAYSITPWQCYAVQGGWASCSNFLAAFSTLFQQHLSPLHFYDRTATSSVNGRFPAPSMVRSGQRNNWQISLPLF
jgi:hypothetical protein